MTEREFRWDASRSYRCFVDERAGTANLVGARIVDDAVGHRIGPVVVVAEADGTVCDLEMQLTPAGNSGRSLPSPSPGEVDRADSNVIASIATDAEPFVELIGEWLIVSFIPDRPGKWRQLAESPVYLLIGGRQLAAIAVRDPEPDIGGLKESAWLDDLDGTSGAGISEGSPVET
jgi:hypothetical protein